MYKLEFENVRVRDDGYGLEVNGESLSQIISTMLGARVGNNYGYNSGLPTFKSDCCNITVTIDPKPITESITINGTEFDSVEDFVKSKEEQYEQTKIPKKAEEEK